MNSRNCLVIEDDQDVRDLLCMILTGMGFVVPLRPHMPSPGQQERLERRRRDYVTLDDSVSVGERQPLPSHSPPLTLSVGQPLSRLQ